jgi:hypothetical protein
MEFGWKRIWQLYGLSELFSKKNKLFYFSISVVLLVLILLLILNHKDDLVYHLLNNLIDDSISIFPTLLGFNLGAYALIIGFLTNDNLRKAVIEGKEEESKNSLERISSVFAINIITQAVTLLCAFLIKEFMQITQTVILSLSYVKVINYLTFESMLFLSLYSIALVIQNAINVFDFNQLFTYFSTKPPEKK